MLVGLVALVVGLVAGAAIGWKVEQNRVKDDVASSKQSQAQNVRPFGKVVAVGNGSVTVRLQTGANVARTFALTPDTVVDRGVAGSRAAIVKGAIVLVRPDSQNGKPVAKEIVVLPASTTFGQG